MTEKDVKLYCVISFSHSLAYFERNENMSSLNVERIIEMPSFVMSR